MRSPSLATVAYTPGIAPIDSAQLQRYVYDELLKASAAIQALAAGHLEQSYAAPLKPRDGDIRYADGTQWNPGAGAGVYWFDGSAWHSFGSGIQSLIVAVGDENVAVVAGTARATFRMPYAFTVTGVRAALVTAQASGSIFTVDINDGGTSILSTKLTIDNTEKTSTTAATAAVISDAALADDAEITVDVDQIGDGTAKGLKVAIIGTRAA